MSMVKRNSHLFIGRREPKGEDLRSNRSSRSTVSLRSKRSITELRSRLIAEEKLDERLRSFETSRNVTAFSVDELALRLDSRAMMTREDGDKMS
jgi:hypothetical protein